jgi:translation initiation factor 2 beta subunit (eIF-2beta)/eIF-5
MSLNINGKTTDNFYRYKMDKIKITQTGRGGNCHTILDNLDTISNQINTTPELLLQYIGMISGCNTNQRLKDNGYVLKGHYDADKIQDSIYSFINFATLCKKCSIPELSPAVIKDGKKSSLIMKCSACGQSYELIGNNKYNDKLVDSMIKYYTNNEFVANKGNMVVNKSNDNFNPFT